MACKSISLPARFDGNKTLSCSSFRGFLHLVVAAMEVDTPSHPPLPHRHTHTQTPEVGRHNKGWLLYEKLEVLNKKKIFNFPKWEAGVGCVPKRGNGEVCACAGLCDLVRGSIQPDVSGHIFQFKIPQRECNFYSFKTFLTRSCFHCCGYILSLLLHF